MGFVAISYAFQQYKNFENQLRFDKITASLKVGTSFETQCRLGGRDRQPNTAQLPKHVSRHQRQGYSRSVPFLGSGETTVRVSHPA